MTRNDVLRMFDAATESALKVLGAFPDYQRTQPEGRFSWAELAVHTVQSEAFALRFLLPAAGIGEAFVLGPPFTEIVALADPAEKQAALGRLNLQGARRTCAKFESMDELRAWWVSGRSATREKLAHIPEEAYETVVKHPLVNWELPLVVMVLQLFCCHLYYHFGQGTEQLKTEGAASSIPFIFGTIN